MASRELPRRLLLHEAWACVGSISPTLHSDSANQVLPPSAIIIVTMIGLIKVKELCHLYKVDKFDFCICMVAFIGVIFFTMVIGLSASASYYT
ncbi:hypothetical protein GUJ93_ZPchr0011g28733 [Zizania palustris]|uniref:SLC26A/SulP transporter domain-containing protein n=1 Tax=Zizania palustris TaxID=103762 RepID=A0A8J5WHM3_ZIZPA|nr:hypothetical protein GUJ93_ZPchr0011g28733 [Zizania palustris]